MATAFTDVVGTSGGGSRAELAGLTGLRGVAALMVFGYHLRWQAGFQEPDWWHRVPGAWWMQACDAGVGLFFALSAFLLSRPFWNCLDGEHRASVLRDPGGTVRGRLTDRVRASVARPAADAHSGCGVSSGGSGVPPCRQPHCASSTGSGLRRRR